MCLKLFHPSGCLSIMRGMVRLVKWMSLFLIGISMLMMCVSDRVLVVVMVVIAVLLVDTVVLRRDVVLISVVSNDVMGVNIVVIIVVTDSVMAGFLVVDGQIMVDRCAMVWLSVCGGCWGSSCWCLLNIDVDDGGLDGDGGLSLGWSGLGSWLFLLLGLVVLLESLVPVVLMVRPVVLEQLLVSIHGVVVMAGILDLILVWVLNVVVRLLI